MAERILFVGRSSEIAKNIQEVLRGFGNKCVFFDHGNTLSQQSRLVRKIIRTFPVFRFFKHWENDRVNKRLLTLTRRVEPTLLLVWNGWNIYPETIQKIKSQGVTTANWFLDLMTHWSIIQKIAPTYDYFFSPDRKVIDALAALGVRASIAPFSYKIAFPQFPEGERRYPISFVGSYDPQIWKKREEFLGAAKEFGVNIWGPPAWQHSSLKENYHGKAHESEMLDIYRQSRIVIDVPWDHLEADAISIRPFEATAAGACLFYYDIRPEISRLFSEGTEYIPFTTTNELKEKLAFYLSRPDLLNSVARAGYTHFMKEHTYQARLKQMLSEIRSR